MKKKFLQGMIKRHPDGFGFFIPEEKTHPDVYIPRNSMTGIMSNDQVVVEVLPERGGERFRGEIVRVVSRGTKHVVGPFSVANDKWAFLKDESHAWGEDLKIKLEDSHGAKEGQLVAAEILKYPESGEGFWGRVSEVIGSVAEPANDIRRIIYKHQIPHVFPEDVVRESESFSEEPAPEEFKNRKDLRSIPLVTIDGVTAKDFDDAVCVETSSNGFLLYVAIADVSHYVKLNSAIDKEAYERGTSVYFPNFVVPMLPEVLSNGLCSLKPQVPRLCLVAEIHLNYAGDVLKTDFYEAVMRSQARVTYGEAQEIVDGQSNSNHSTVVQENILRCADLAKVLMAKRFREGSLDLEIPESELEIDASGVPVDVIRSERLFAHRLIEELMLAANVAVARFFEVRKIPAIYRIHEPPDSTALQLLENYMRNFGGKIRLESGKLQKRLTQALEQFEGKPEALILHILTLRSMSQAKYSPNNVGHFGLGFEFYTHFTSPIRRYPDLIVHRLLKNQILRNSQYRLMSEEDLQSAGTWLSACEQRSVKAERQLQAIKKARFMEKFVGQEFEGLISSVARFGVFVLLREYDIDGLVRTENLAKEKLDFDEEKLRLVARRSGLSYSVGDTLKIRVESADHDLGQINFVLLQTPKSQGSSTRSEDSRDRQQRRRPEGKFKNSRRKNRREEKGEGPDREETQARGERGVREDHNNRNDSKKDSPRAKREKTFQKKNEKRLKQQGPKKSSDDNEKSGKPKNFRDSEKTSAQRIGFGKNKGEGSKRKKKSFGRPGQLKLKVYSRG